MIILYCIFPMLSSIQRKGHSFMNSIIYCFRATVDCQVASDKSEFLFNFDQPFEIHDDVEVLKRLGLAHGLERGELTPEVSENIKKNLPPSLRDFVDQIMKGKYFLRTSFCFKDKFKFHATRKSLYITTFHLLKCKMLNRLL